MTASPSGTINHTLRCGVVGTAGRGASVSRVVSPLWGSMREILSRIASLSRLSVWAGRARDRLAELAEEQRADAERLRDVADDLNRVGEVDAAKALRRCASRCEETAQWAEDMITSIHAAVSLLWADDLQG